MPWIGGALAGAGALASGVLGFAGQASANEANREMSESQRQFAIGQSQADKQWNMMMFAQNYQNQLMARKTSYQTAVQDMKEAGLNPMLAYQQGGAGNVSQGAPTATSMNYTPARMENKFAAAAHSAQQLGTQAQAIQESMSRAELLEAQKGLLKAQTEKELSGAGRDVAETERTRMDIQYLEKTFVDRVKKLGYESLYAYYDQLEKKFKAGIASSEDMNAARYFGARAEEMMQQAKIRGLQVPEWLAQAAYWRSEAGKFQPFVQTPTRVLGSAAEAAVSAGEAAYEKGKDFFKGLRR